MLRRIIAIPQVFRLIPARQQPDLQSSAGKCENLMQGEPSNDAIVNKILSGARWATVLRMVAQIISWTCTIFVVRFISQEDYGLNAMLEAPAELLLLVSTFGLETALVRARSVGQAELRSTFGWLLLLNGTLFVAYFFSSGLIADYFNEPRLEQLGKILAFVFLFVPFRVIPNAMLDRELKFKPRALAELVTSIVSAIATLIMAILGAGIWALIAGLLLNRALHMMILMALQPWFLRPSLRFREVKELIAFGGTMTLASAVAITGYMLPTLIAGPRLGPEALGIFVVSLQLALLPLSKVMPVINPIIFPAFSKFQGQRATIAHYMEKSVGIAALALLPPMVGLACVAEECVPAGIGEKWSPAVLPLALLSLSVPFRGLTSFIRQVLGAVGQPGLAVKSTVATWVLLFVLIVMGVNHGIMALVIAVLIAETTTTLVTIHLSTQAIDTSFSRIAFALRPAIVCSAVMAICVIGVKYLLLNQLGTVRLVGEIATGAVTCVVILRVFFAGQLRYRASVTEALSALTEDRDIRT